MSKNYLQLIVFSFSVVLGMGMLIFDESTRELDEVKRNIRTQQRKNVLLAKHVSELKRSIYSFRKDDRYLEQVARNELALARDNETMYLFE
jgi:cell division protein FtsB